ncbi:unnamed protein product, partial [Mesorhabditis belari]|uniref:Uncharacterized protein n=1 Tax=Mesorhabditis belari TaxID=2138241 RepID=A0AAF3FCG9_9BILA
MYITFLVFATFSTVSSINECVRPWQQPMLTRALIGQPPRAHICHPEGTKCPKGRNEQCQFSFRNFRYVCCEDRPNEDPPECPRYHDTLLTLCDGRENGCPKGFRCLGSRHDESIHLCCRPNLDLKYPEPETTFKDKKLVPKYLPIAPKNVAQIHFGNHTILTGELFSVDELERLVMEPTIELPQWNNQALYTIILFDISSPNPVYVRWLALNVPMNEGLLAVNSKARIVEVYDAPHREDKPTGMHVLILAVFEQKDVWNGKSIGKFDPIGVNVGDWIRKNEEIIPLQPIAGNFYAYMTITD